MTGVKGPGTCRVGMWAAWEGVAAWVAWSGRASGEDNMCRGRWCAVSEKGVAGGGTGRPGWNNSQEGEGRAGG